MAADGATQGAVARRRALLWSPVRRSMVEHLAAAPGGLTAAELGKLMGLHVTTVRFHLEQMVTGGLVTTRSVRRGGAGRPSKRYALAVPEAMTSAPQSRSAQSLSPQSRAPGSPSPGERSGGGTPYELLATVLARVADPSAPSATSPEQAGAEWARRRAAPVPTEVQPWPGRASALVGVLAEWGYPTQVSAQPLQGLMDVALPEAGAPVELTLHDCPFLDLARAHPAAVCGIHRGLLRGALERVGEPDAEVTLQPFTRPRTCRAVLTPASGRGDQ